MTLPSGSSPNPVPQPNDTIYVTEIYSAYSPITPLGALVNITGAEILYNVAYF